MRWQRLGDQTRLSGLERPAVMVSDLPLLDQLEYNKP